MSGIISDHDGLTVISDTFFGDMDKAEEQREISPRLAALVKLVILEKNAEIAHLRDERNRELGSATLKALADVSAAAVRELKAENARLRESLAQYADHENWITDVWTPHVHGWEVAEAALKGEVRE